MNKLTSNIDKIALFDGTIIPDNWELTNLKQINCFIGPNNSGKSRKIRELFTSDISQWIIDTYSLPMSKILTRALEYIENSNFAYTSHQKISTV